MNFITHNNNNKFEKGKSVLKISYTSQSIGSDFIRQKENEQPNNKNNENQEHIESETVICHSNEESPNHLFDTNWWKRNLDSSFSYREEFDQSERTNLNEISSLELEYIIKSLQESLQMQNKLEENLKFREEKETKLIRKVESLEEKLRISTSQNLLLCESINNLQKEVSTKNKLNQKCVSLEKQLRKAEVAMKKINSNLKSSEHKRLTLQIKLDDNIQESTNTARKLREQYGSAPFDSNSEEKSITLFENEIHNEFFQDINFVLAKILDSFHYNNNLVGLTLKEDKQLKEIWSRLLKYQQQSSYIYGFINKLSKIMSLKLTCEKYITMEIRWEKQLSESNKQLSTGKKKMISPKDKNLKIKGEKKKAINRGNLNKKQSNYLNYK